MLAHFQREISCAEGGGEDQLMAADPPHRVLGPFDARLETCAVAAFGFDKSNPHSKRREVHCMPIT